MDFLFKFLGVVCVCFPFVMIYYQILANLKISKTNMGMNKLINAEIQDIKHTHKWISR